jgi:hypothetical protein
MLGEANVMKGKPLDSVKCLEDLLSSDELGAITSDGLRQSSEFARVARAVDVEKTLLGRPDHYVQVPYQIIEQF